jgi:molybdopterin synthase catalytic subunit
VLVDGDELAVIPPVSGGAPEGDAAIHTAITDQPLSVDKLIELVRHPGAGAIVTFHGTTRSVDRLDYEAYDEMAGELLARIVDEVAAKHGVLAAAAEHRTGSVPLGEASVVVAVSSAHRPEAFAAARETIDRIKQELPVWKREVEHTDAGESANWVEGTPVKEEVR